MAVFFGDFVKFSDLGISNRIGSFITWVKVQV